MWARFMKRAFILLLLLSGAMGSTAALAHGGHVRFGLVIGAPAFWYPPPYYYYPQPYYPPVVVAPSAPPVYVERQDSPPASVPSDAYWYYCPDTKSYYPYVKECPSAWQRVAPRPPNS
jgi:hypothetical protein